MNEEERKERRKNRQSVEREQGSPAERLIKDED